MSEIMVTPLGTSHPADDLCVTTGCTPAATIRNCPECGPEWVGSGNALVSHLTEDHGDELAVRALSEALSEALYDASLEEILGVTDEQLDDVARVVLDSDWFTGVRRDAWDEGYEAAISDTEARSAPPGPNGPVDPTTNPYPGGAR